MCSRIECFPPFSFICNPSPGLPTTLQHLSQSLTNPQKKKSHLERRLFLTTSSAQLPSSLLLVRLVFKGYLNIKKNHIKYILLLWNAHAHKNTSSSHCIVLNHYYCCIYIYIYIYIYINPNQYHLQQYHHYTPSSSPLSPTSMGWTSNEDIEVQLRDINQVVTKAFFDDWKKP